MLTYTVVDGENSNQLIVLLGFATYEEDGKTENLPDDLYIIASTIKSKVISAMTSETLVFRADMSYFPKQVLNGIQAKKVTQLLVDNCLLSY
jgi:hypothetical protein